MSEKPHTLFPNRGRGAVYESPDGPTQPTVSTSSHSSLGLPGPLLVRLAHNSHPWQLTSRIYVAMIVTLFPRTFKDVCLNNSVEDALASRVYAAMIVTAYISEHLRTYV